MRLVRPIFVCLAVALLSACSKNSEDQENTPPPPPVDSCNNIIEVQQYYPVALEHWQALFKLDHDSQGRVSVMEIGVPVHYEYFKDKIVQSNIDGYGNYNSIVYSLNEKGLITGHNYFDHHYTYNADGYMISFRQPYSNGAGGASGYHSWQLRYENNNLVEATTDADISKPIINLEYYDEPNQDFAGYNSPVAAVGAIGASDKYILVKGGFYGKQSANLLKMVNVHDVYPPEPIQYHKDSKGRITQMGGDLKVIYQCP